MIMNTSYIFQNLSRHKTEVINFDKIKPHMIKLISTGSYIVFMDPKFYIHGYMTKVELQKNSQSFLSRETIYHN